MSKQFVSFAVGLLCLVTLGATARAQCPYGEIGLGAIESFAVFSEDGLQISGSTSFETLDGCGTAVGSNGNVEFQNNVGDAAVTLTGGGSLNAGTGPTGGLIFDGDVSAAFYGHVQGNINSHGLVTIGRDTEVDGDIITSGSVYLWDHAVVNGSIWAEGDFKVNTWNHADFPVGVTGNVFTNGNAIFESSGGAMKILGNLTWDLSQVNAANHVIGTIYEYTHTDGIEPLTYIPLALDPTAPLTAGSIDVAVGSGESVYLTPGAYRDVSVVSNGGSPAAELYLEAGDYVFNSLLLAHHSVLHLPSSGTVNVRVAGNGDVWHTSAIVIGGYYPGDVETSVVDILDDPSQLPDGLDVWWEIHGQMVFQWGAMWFGTTVSMMESSANQWAIELPGNDSVVGSFRARGRIRVSGTRLLFVPPIFGNDQLQMFSQALLMLEDRPATIDGGFIDGVSDRDLNDKIVDVLGCYISEQGVAANAPDQTRAIDYIYNFRADGSDRNLVYDMRHTIPVVYNDDNLPYVEIVIADDSGAVVSAVEVTPTNDRGHFSINFGNPRELAFPDAGTEFQYTDPDVVNSGTHYVLGSQWRWPEDSSAVDIDPGSDYGDVWFDRADDSGIELHVQTHTITPFFSNAVRNLSSMFADGLPVGIRGDRPAMEHATETTDIVKLFPYVTNPDILNPFDFPNLDFAYLESYPSLRVFNGSICERPEAGTCTRDSDCTGDGEVCFNLDCAVAVVQELQEVPQ